MKTRRISLPAVVQVPLVLLSLMALNAPAAVRYVNVNSAAPTPPYTTWSTAARTIQEAVDAAVASDQILVANGVYQTGGQSVDGESNRVAVTKPVTVQSVNGPALTAINGAGVMRCVYLTNGARLTGFTLTNGYLYSGQGGGALGGTLSNCNLVANSAQYGGGANNSALHNCTLQGNSSLYGGGAYACTLSNCTLTGNAAGTGGGAHGSLLDHCTLKGNRADDTSGGGAAASTLNDCTLESNFDAGASFSTLNHCRITGHTRGGAWNCSLNNCTLVDNSNNGGAVASRLNGCTLWGNTPFGAIGCTMTNCTVTDNAGFGAYASTLYNSIVYHNSGSNYDFNSTLNYCCTTPLPTNGLGNITTEPQLVDPAHLSAGSPCRAAGNAAYTNGLDIDGGAWATPPSIGCDEFPPGPATGPLSVLITADCTNLTTGFAATFTASIAGRATANRWEFGDGTVLSNRAVVSHGWTSAGNYAVVLRAYSDTFPAGVSAAVAVRVMDHPVHYVALNSPNPAAPYLSWATAARNIQDAINAACPGGTVLVSNGVYQTGGQWRSGVSNRIVVAKPVTVQSLNGPAVTLIRGEYGMRCALLTEGAMLNGFTLTNGYASYGQQGGGAFGGVLTNCVLVANHSYSGGGAVSRSTLFRCRLSDNDGGGASSSTLIDCTVTGNSGSGASDCTLIRCTLTDNSASEGGGALSSRLFGCTLTGNQAAYGGGAARSVLTNCTLTGNTAYNTAYNSGGVYECDLGNCIVYHNIGGNYDRYSSLNYCCTTPMPGSGTNNITDEPQLADLAHVSACSPCRGAGSAIWAAGTDVDGEPWGDPPSIGCDELRPTPITGPLGLTTLTPYTNVATGLTLEFTSRMTGHASASRWEFGDGTIVSNRPVAVSHSWSAPGDYTVVLRAYNDTFPAGQTATVTIHVREQPVHYVSANSTNPVPPYFSWDTAATNLQSAAAAAYAGGTVLVTNGVYGSLFLEAPQPMTIRSVNGAAVTVIDGSSSGLCSFIRPTQSRVTIEGFTLTNGVGNPWDAAGGATGGRLVDCVVAGHRGHGAQYCTLVNCTITDNQASGALFCALFDCELTNNGIGAYGCALSNCVVANNPGQQWPFGVGVRGCLLLNCTLTGHAGYGAESSTLLDCTLSSNALGGAWNCILTNCTVTGNLRDGVDYCGLSQCTVASNAWSGAYHFSVLDRCLVTGNGGDGIAIECVANQCTISDNLGGGAIRSRLTGCELTRNAYAASSSQLDNCALTGNSIGGAEFSDLNHCSVVGNWGVGVVGSRLTNSIVYYNAGGNWSPDVIFNHCCTTPLPFNGANIITAEPLLTDLIHLSAESPCRGAGSAEGTTGVDFDGEPWGNPPSIGADEFQAGPVTGPLSVSVLAEQTTVATGLPVTFAVDVVGRASAIRWELGDGTVVSNRLWASHQWTAAGEYEVVVRAYNDDFPEGVSATLLIQVMPRLVHYVAAISANPTPPYASWETAALTIQDAVDVATLPGSTVVVSNGVYPAVVVPRPLFLEGLNGAAETIIDGNSAARCVSLAARAVLTGFTLTNGFDPSWNVGGARGGTLNHCLVTGNAGDGAYACTLNHCTLTNNAGNGATLCALTNCVLTSNAFSGAWHSLLDQCTLAWNSGGGAYGCGLTSCVLRNNGGGAAYSRLAACMLAGNAGTGVSYCALYHCTLTGNGGYGAEFSDLDYCVVYNNDNGNYFECTLNYCCTTPLPESGAGNITAEPQLADPAHLSAGSPCRGAGNAAQSSGVDIDGEAWSSPPSIGCDEIHPGPITGPLSVSRITATFTNITTEFSVRFTSDVFGHATANRWEFGDGTILSNRFSTEHCWNAPGIYEVVFRAYNDSFPDGVSATVTIRVLAQPVHHVAAQSTNPIAPYLSWATAANHLQDAVDAAYVGGTVLVSNGVFAPIVVSNPVTMTIRSVNGPAVTVIDGQGTQSCVRLPEEGEFPIVVLTGFTLTNGAAEAGGGALGGTLSNCVLVGNSAQFNGGGAQFTVLHDCILTGNSAPYGGGAFVCRMHRCWLAGNSAEYGGGAASGTLSNCVLRGNEATRYGGGAVWSLLGNCTVVANTAIEYGGGAHDSALDNCILYHNAAPLDPNYSLGSSGYLNHCCTTPMPTNSPWSITNEPRFVDLPGGNLHLRPDSPCINSGDPFLPPAGLDLDGNPRVAGATVDIGAYEFQSPTSIISYAWLLQYGLPTDGSADHADPDGDHFDNWQESRAGTSPIDASSLLRVSNISINATGVTLTWRRVSGVTYFVERTAAIGEPFTTIAEGIADDTYTDTTALGDGPFFYRVGVR